MHLRRLSIIVFNYDRCLEQFLVRALMNYFRMGYKEAAELVRLCVIKHPYGSLGPFLAEDGGEIAFGGGSQIDMRPGLNLLSMARRLRTYTEQITDEVALASQKSLLERANTVVFLGFEFHQQNMDSLEVSRDSNVERVFSTAFRVPDPEIPIIRRKVIRSMRTSVEHTMASAECSDFLRNYAGLLAQE